MLYRMRAVQKNKQINSTAAEKHLGGDKQNNVYWHRFSGVINAEKQCWRANHKKSLPARRWKYTNSLTALLRDANEA